MGTDHLERRAAEVLRARRGGLVGQVDNLARIEALLADTLQEVRHELCTAARLLASLDEVSGATDQLPLDALSGELRGRRLREVAVQVLRRQVPVGTAVHYRELLRLLQREGVRVGGKDPAASLLTQLVRADELESVRPRSGLYRLRVGG